jgi:PAS domain S-box-containing protein
LLELIPDALGRNLPQCFGDDAPNVNLILKSRKKSRITRMALHTGDERIAVTAEFGPIVLIDGSERFYALVGDRRPYFEAQTAGLEAVPLGIVQFNESRRVIFINAQGAELLSSSAYALLDKPIADIFGAAPDVLEGFERCFMSGRGFTHEVEVPRIDKRSLPLRLIVMPQFDTSRRTTHVLCFFRSIQIERARNEIYRACRDFRKPKSMLREVLRILHELIPFDKATVGVYADDMEYFRAFLVEPTPKEAWPNRWFRIPEPLVEWIKGDKTWVPDLEAFLRSYPEAKELLENPVTQGFIAEGIKSFVSLPVHQDKEVVTVLTLLSREPAKFNREHLALLKELPVEQALRMANDQFVQMRYQFLGDTLKILPATRSHHELAQLICKRLSKYFEWDHVSIFKVNRIKKRFELIAQSGSTAKPHMFRKGHQVAIGKGMLTEALLQDGVHYVDDLSNSTGGLGLQEGSALCVPIKFDGKGAWMLTVWATQTNAFHGPDLVALTSVVAELGRALDNLIQAKLADDFLDLTDQGVVVVDGEGQIRNLNRAAEAMLGAPRVELVGRPFAGFFADPVIKEEIEENTQTITERHSVVVDIYNEQHPVIVSIRRPIEEYDHRIWLLTDTVQHDWSREFRYLREVSHDVAQQTRVPLMMAVSFLKKCDAMFKNPRSKDLIRKTLEQLEKVDLTYERLVVGLDGRRGVADTRSVLDLGSYIELLRGELPFEDRYQVQIPSQAGPYLVRVREHAIDFVLRSILLYLLRRKPLDCTVLMQVQMKGPEVVLTLTITKLDESTGAAREQTLPNDDLGSLIPADYSQRLPVPVDSISKLMQEARTTAALNPEAIDAIVKAHGGKLVTPDDYDPRVGPFTITLPAETGHA